MGFTTDSNLVPRNWFKWLMPFVSLAVLLLVLVILHRSFAGYHLRDVFVQLHKLPGRIKWLASFAALASYILLCGYDLLALRYLRQNVSVVRTMLASFIAFSIGHNVGLTTLSGGAIRLRLYGAVGVPATDVAIMSGFCVLTTTLGAVALIAYSLMTHADAASQLLHLPSNVLFIIGILLTLMFIAYCIWSSQRKTPLVWRNWSLSLPRPSMTLAQTIVAALDLCLAAWCLYLLLPDSVSISYQTFLAIYVLSIIAVMITNVPGGLGVFESVIVLSLPSLPVDKLLASLLAFRVIYYLAPLVLASLFLVSHEFWLQRHHVRKAAGVMRDWMSALAPLAMGALVLVAGSVLLLSGATPSIAWRLRTLSKIVPLPVLELSHLLGSVAGLGLVVLSRALIRRVHLAWQLALALLLAGALFSLLKGWDYEECIIMLVVAGLLVITQDAFYRRAALLESHVNLRWLLGVVMIVGVVIWVGMLARLHLQYSHELWWTFAFESDAPRILRAALAICLIIAAFILHAWLSPRAPVVTTHDTNDKKQVEQIVGAASHAVANLALLGDKRLLIHPQADAFLMYQVSGRSWISMGDPILSVGVDVQRASELAWSFREASDEYGGWTVFYQVTPGFLPVYVDLGLALLKLGEEARVSLPEFSLEGSHRAEFRTVRRRAEREGISFEVLPPPLSVDVLQQLQIISQEWLTAKSAHEKRFSVGFFSPEYISQFPTAVVRRDGKIIAFANLWPTYNHQELSVDLMRYGNHSLPGMMDYLFVEAMLWGKAQGYQWFNLGMAPLSGLEQHYLAPAWHRIANFVFDMGEHFYNFEGLRNYKQKFSPVWEPRYLAAPGGLALPRVLLDVASLIAGGLREIISK